MQRLDGDTVRKLGSYQVITSVDAAIKELLENSLDSGATTVGVKLTDSGLKTIVVSDDGSGIEEVILFQFCSDHMTPAASRHQSLWLPSVTSPPSLSPLTT